MPRTGRGTRAPVAYFTRLSRGVTRHPPPPLQAAFLFYRSGEASRASPSKDDRLVTVITAAVSAVAGSINGKRNVQSALKFLLAGMALVIVVGLGAIFYFLFEGGQESKKAAIVQPQAGQQKSAAAASSQCPVSDPANGYVSGKYVFSLSNEVFPPSPSLAKEIQNRYGNNAALADWGDLKAMLANEDDVRKFIQDTGIQLQSTNYNCDNILVSRSGSETVQGLHYHLARHDGKVPPDWSVLDSIGSNDINLGRWNHSGQALLRMPQSQ